MQITELSFWINFVRRVLAHKEYRCSSLFAVFWGDPERAISLNSRVTINTKHSNQSANYALAECWFYGQNSVRKVWTQYKAKLIVIFFSNTYCINFVKSPCIKLNSCFQCTLGLRLNVYAFFRNIIGFWKAFISQNSLRQGKLFINGLQ